MELKPGYLCPKGYKQTEVGVIPEDWIVLKASDACSKIQDGTHFSPRISGNDNFYVTSKNIRSGYLDMSTASRIDSAQHQAIYRRCDVKKGDVLLTKDGANTGNAALNTLDEEFSLLSSVAFLRFHQSKCAAYFLQQILSSPGQHQIQDAMAGNAITRLTLEKINKLCFPVPPTKAEQEAIADALSDADALIESLEQLIAKKRDLKQGTMQELLTGKKRLPAYQSQKSFRRCELGSIPDDWQCTQLPNLTVRGPGSIKIGPFGSALKRKYLTKDGFKVYGQENVYEKNMDTGDRFINREHFRKLQSCEIKAGDFLISMMGTVGKCFIVPAGIKEGIMDSHLLRLRLDSGKLSSDFLAQLFETRIVFNQVRQLSVGGIMEGLSSKIIKSLSLPVPTVEEQISIAEVLSDMDAEIAALETRLAKSRSLKQGMMSNLLTGKIRLG